MKTDPKADPKRVTVAIVGGGQAGLSMSYCLKERGIDHAVFERHRVGHEWRRRRWDSFCLVTPNWQCKLPGFPYRGDDAHGFMGKPDIVRYLEDYAASFAPPLLPETTVTALRATPRDWAERVPGAFHLATSGGDFVADQVVVATGGYHVPTLPRLAERLPESIAQLHSCDYRSPAALPEGAILVVGTGQSGCQIAEDLHIAGRRVHLSVGSAPRTARRYRGKDVVDWLDAMGYYAMPVHDHPLQERVRAKANHYVTGRDGGRDIDLRRRALEGMKLHGRLCDVRSGKLHFASDLRQNLDQADAVAESIKDSIDNFIRSRHIEAPPEDRYQPPWQPDGAPSELDLQHAGIGAVVFSTGFRSDYGWLEVPVFDGRGQPVHRRGVTPVPGLFFLGLPWLHTWGSGRFSGVGDDARHLADQIEARLVAIRPAAPAKVNEHALGS